VDANGLRLKGVLHIEGFQFRRFATDEVFITRVVQERCQDLRLKFEKISKEFLQTFCVGIR